MRALRRFPRLLIVTLGGKADRPIRADGILEYVPSDRNSGRWHCSCRVLVDILMARLVEAGTADRDSQVRVRTGRRRSKDLDRSVLQDTLHARRSGDRAAERDLHARGLPPRERTDRTGRPGRRHFDTPTEPGSGSAQPVAAAAKEEAGPTCASGGCAEACRGPTGRCAGPGRRAGPSRGIAVAFLAGSSDTLNAAILTEFIEIAAPPRGDCAFMRIQRLAGRWTVDMTSATIAPKRPVEYPAAGLMWRIRS